MEQYLFLVAAGNKYCFYRLYYTKYLINAVLNSNSYKSIIIPKISESQTKLALRFENGHFIMCQMNLIKKVEVVSYLQSTCANVILSIANVSHINVKMCLIINVRNKGIQREKMNIKQKKIPLCCIMIKEKMLFLYCISSQTSNLLKLTKKTIINQLKK